MKNNLKIIPWKKEESLAQALILKKMITKAVVYHG